MFRSRFATLALAAGLGLASGCSCLTERPWFNFSRFRCPSCPECETGCSPCCNGQAIEEGGPLLVPPTGPVVPPPQDYAIPPLAPQPRLVPQPQAPADAYSPTKNGRPRLLGQLDR